MPSAESIGGAASTARSIVTAPGWMRALARLGFAAKGVVVLIVGGLAMSGSVRGGKQGAFTEIVRQPFGRVLLTIVAAGLVAYAVWRLVSGLFDPHDEADDDAKGVGKRIGYVVSGAIYAALAVAAAGIVIGSGADAGGDGAQRWTGKLLELRFGQILVGVIAIGVAIAAVYQGKQAITADFCKNFRLGEMSAGERTWATRAGRLGHAARALVYALSAWFLASAALADEEQRAGGLVKALQTLRQQPYGSWLLGVVGLGLVCYGLYCFVVARYCNASK